MKNIKNKILILGSGSYSTAIAHILLESEENDVIIYGIDNEEIKDLNNNKMNSKYFPSMLINKRVRATNNLQEALEDVDIIMFGTPSSSVIKLSNEIIKLLNKPVIWVNLAKGFNPEQSSNKVLIVNELRELIPSNLNKGICKVSGPTFASELIKKAPSSLTIGCEDIKSANEIHKIFDIPFISTEVSDDLIGVDFFSIIKNPLAIFLGIVSEMGISRNTKAMLFVLCIKEMYKFQISYPSIKAETFLGYSGIGDLYLTGSSSKSRNYELGRGIAISNEYNPLLHRNKTIEGIESIKFLMNIAKERDIKLNIIPLLDDIINKKVKPKELILSFLDNANKIY